MMERIVEQKLLRDAMLRDAVIVRAESRHAFPHQDKYHNPEVKIHKMRPIKKSLPSLARSRYVILMGRLVYLDW